MVAAAVALGFNATISKAQVNTILYALSGIDMHRQNQNPHLLSEAFAIKLRGPEARFELEDYLRHQPRTSLGMTKNRIPSIREISLCTGRRALMK